MQEIVPIAIGIVIGGACGLPDGRLGRTIALFLAAPALGAAWSVVAGEAAETPVLVLWDAFQAVAAALLAAVAATRLAGRARPDDGRSSRPRARASGQQRDPVDPGAVRRDDDDRPLP
jgi:hypothetical protein